MQELSTLPGFTIYQNLMALNTSLHILDKNFQELESFVADLTINPKWDHLFLVENRHILHKLSEDIVRRLHNFLAAVISLRDHTRRLYSKYYQDEGLIPGYEGKIREIFIENSEAQFVQNLRQYCQHYVSPLLSFQSFWESDKGRPRRVAVLRKDELLLFDGWNSSAKKYLLDSHENIDFLASVRNYHSTVFKFYEWFQRNQEKAHSDDLAEFRVKEGELLCLQLEDKLDRCLILRDELHCSEQSLFFHIFTKPQFEALSEAPRLHKERASKAVEILSERFIISDQLETKIREVYSLEVFRYYEPDEINIPKSTKLNSWARSLIMRFRRFRNR